MDERVAFLKEITDIPGVSGYEEEVGRYIAAKMTGLAQVSKDNLGSVICRKEGSQPSPRIMLAGHMDEIGMMVTYITKEGFLKFQTLGGWWEQVMLAQRVTVKTRAGDVLGIIGSKPPHILKGDERNKVVQKDQMFIDIGASSQEEAESMGIMPGDPIVPVSPFAQMKNPKFLMAKAWDDRIGCAIFMDVIRALQGQDHSNTVYGVGTVQEEVGLRGATTSVSVVEPDIGFSLEADIPGDTPGVQEHEARSKLGNGPSLLLYDSSMIPHVRLRNFVVETARAIGVPLQFNTIPGGGTDAGRIHVYKNGVPSICLCIPTRYVHCHAGIIHMDDYDAAVRLVTEMIKRLDAETVAKIRG